MEREPAAPLDGRTVTVMIWVLSTDVGLATTAVVVPVATSVLSGLSGTSVSVTRDVDRMVATCVDTSVRIWPLGRLDVVVTVRTVVAVATCDVVMVVDELTALLLLAGRADDDEEEPLTGRADEADVPAVAAVVVGSGSSRKMVRVCRSVVTKVLSCVEVKTLDWPAWLVRVTVTMDTVVCEMTDEITDVVMSGRHSESDEVPAGSAVEVGAAVVELLKLTGLVADAAAVLLLLEPDWVVVTTEPVIPPVRALEMTLLEMEETKAVPELADGSLT